MQPSEKVHDLTIQVTKRIRSVPLDEIITLPRSGYRIKEILPAKGIALVYGASGSGKTFLTLDMVGAITQGNDWFGHRVKKTGAVIIAAEGEQGISDRLNAYLVQRGNVGMPLEVIPCQVDMLTTTADTVTVIEEIRESEKRIGKIGIVVIDTLNRVCPGGDEGGSDMSAFLSNVDALRRSIDGLVLIVHHTGKDVSRGARGHSSLIAAVDASIEVTRDGDFREFRVEKLRDGKDGRIKSFMLESINLGTDEDGDMVASCIIQETDSPQKAKTRKLTKPAKIGLDALKETIEKNGKPLPSYIPVAASVRAVTLDEWREAHKTRYGTDDKGINERSAWRRCKEALIGDLVIVHDPYAWIP